MNLQKKAMLCRQARAKTSDECKVICGSGIGGPAIQLDPKIIERLDSIETRLDSLVQKRVRCMTQPKTVVDLYVPPRAPKPEPFVRISFDGIEVRVGLTGLHHLNNCQGWGNKDSYYYLEDLKLRDLLLEIERRMYDADAVALVGKR